jgi:hypothetical protein
VYLDNHPITCYHLGQYLQLDEKLLQERYKEHISEYGNSDQKSHADHWMLFFYDVSPRSSINETALSMVNYISLSLTKIQGQKGAIVAIINGT